MFINNKLAQCKQQRIQNYAQNSDAYGFFNLLTDAELLSSVEALLPEHRERLFPPTLHSEISARATAADKSINQWVSEILKRSVND